MNETVDYVIDVHGVHFDAEQAHFILHSDLGRLPTEREWRSLCQLLGVEVEKAAWEAEGDDVALLIERAAEIRTWKMLSMAAETRRAA